MAGVLFFLFLILAMWVMVVLPQQRRQRAHRQLVSALDVGQDVITTAGVYGTIRALDGDIVGLEIAEGVEIRIARQAILRPAPAPAPDLDTDSAADTDSIADTDSAVGDLLSAGANEADRAERSE